MLGPMPSVTRALTTKWPISVSTRTRPGLDPEPPCIIWVNPQGVRVGRFVESRGLRPRVRIWVGSLKAEMTTS
jgi:hypothetical protein